MKKSVKKASNETNETKNFYKWKKPCQGDLLEYVKEFALAFNKLGVSIDIESKKFEQRVVFSDGIVDVVVHYRMIVMEGMHNILRRFNGSPRSLRLEEFYAELDPAELRAVTMCERPLTQEALQDATGRSNLSPEEWLKTFHSPDVQEEIEREKIRQRTKVW